MTTIDTVTAAGVAAAHPQLIQLSRDLYDHPETAWEEVRSRHSGSPVSCRTTGFTSPNGIATSTPRSPRRLAVATCTSHCVPNTTLCPASGTRAVTT